MWSIGMSSLPLFSHLPSSPSFIKLVIKKKQTQACDLCRKRKGRCSGVWPCSFCVTKSVDCHFTQQCKRGRKKVDLDENTSSPLAKAQKLWSTTERCQVVDSFCAMRMNLLDVSAIKEGTSPTLTAQSYMLNAWMARLAHDYDKANQYKNQAVNMMDMTDPDLVGQATTYLLLADYVPSDPSSYSKSWELIKSANLKTPNDRHVYFYAMSYSAVNYTSLKYSNIVSTGSDAMQSSNIDIWDTTNLLVMKVCTQMRKLWDNLSSPHFFRNISTLTLAKEKRDAVMMDIRTAEIIMQSHSLKFGFEYHFCLQIIKIVLLWVSEKRDNAVSESIAMLDKVIDIGNRAMFLIAESRFMIIPLMIVNHAGIIKYNTVITNTVEDICREQRSLIDDLIPLFEELRTGDPPLSSPPSSSSPPVVITPTDFSAYSSLPVTPSPSSFASPISIPSTPTTTSTAFDVDDASTFLSIHLTPSSLLSTSPSPAAPTPPFLSYSPSLLPPSSPSDQLNWDDIDLMYFLNQNEV